MIPNLWEWRICLGNRYSIEVIVSAINCNYIISFYVGYGLYRYLIIRTNLCQLNMFNFFIVICSMLSIESIYLTALHPIYSASSFGIWFRYLGPNSPLTPTIAKQTSEYLKTTRTANNSSPSSSASSSSSSLNRKWHYNVYYLAPYCISWCIWFQLEDLFCCILCHHLNSHWT